MLTRSRRCGLVAAFVAAIIVVPSAQTQPQPKTAPKTVAADKDTRPFTDEFHVEPGELGPTGRNPYFILEPGHYRVMKKGDEEVTITVLDETKKVDGVETRVIEEKETKNGQVIEISRNFFAISKRTNNVYYFGEEVDIYENGKIVEHTGAWLSGVKGAKYGLWMPGTILIGARFCNEVAPDAAMDRSEVVRLTATVETPAGTFKNCVTMEDTTPLEPGVKEYKSFARGIGMVKDNNVELIKHGFLEKKK